MYPAGRNRPYSELSPVETLEGTVSRMQRDLDNLQTENRFLRTTGPVPLVRQAALTTTKVPWFSGSTSWEQYQQVFDAIVLSNGWDDATAALMLLSHLQGDALSVALLMPMPRRASRKELTDALSSHYGSPGRLASYRRQFDKTERKPDQDPANFGITLETLAIKAFGDIGQTSRLRLIRDRFITGHECCELRQHLDCLPPDTRPYTTSRHSGPMQGLGKSFRLVGTECQSTKNYLSSLCGQAVRPGTSTGSDSE